MKTFPWQRRFTKLVGYGSRYLVTCAILFPVWALFVATPNAPPPWQQAVLAVLLPFGLLLKLPTNTWGGIAGCMVLNTVFWAVLTLIVREGMAPKRS